MMKLSNSKGLTLVEVVIAMGVLGLLFASLLAGFLSVKAINAAARNYMQGAEAVRSQVESLKVTPFGNIANSVTNNVSIGCGPNGVIGDADDIRGTLSVTVIDGLDFDGDNNMVEAAIDVDGDGLNDVGSAVPVRVSLTWNQRLLGINQVKTITADTIIAA